MYKQISKLLPIFAFLCIFLFPLATEAQYFKVGQDPSWIKWREIQSDHFQLIYPSDYEEQAQKVACVFTKVYAYSGLTLKHVPRKISIILHTKSNKSNGFVAWSPSRIELYPTPSQDIYAQNWIEQLAIHELRHHVQIDKIESELPGIFKVLFGEQAASVVVGAYLPFWFLEGDAVVSETAFSHSGRGRLPSFSMELKALADEKALYSFDKAYLGSYKDYIPDYYQLGYQMVSYIRNQNGGEVWSKVLHHIARKPLSFNALSKGLRLATGQNQNAHYLSMMKYLKANNPFEFNQNLDSTEVISASIKKKDTYASYQYPFQINDSTIVALKKTMENIPCFVIIQPGYPERRVFEPGPILDESVNFANGKLIWIESLPDVRWTHNEKSLLRIFDLDNQTLVERKFAGKIFAPALTHDGKSLAFVELDDQNRCSIGIVSNLDSLLSESRDFGNSSTLQKEGDQIHVFNQVGTEFKNRKDNWLNFRIPASPNHLFITPSWSSTNNELFAVDLSQNRKALVQINIQSGITTELTTPSFAEIKKPFQNSNNLYFTSTLAGKEEGYALDLLTKKSYRIASPRYGMKDMQLTKNGKRILYCDYTSNGYKIAQTENSTHKWIESGVLRPYKDTLAEKMASQESGVINFLTDDTTRFQSKKYSKIKNLMNFHSWAPMYIDPDNSIINNGFSIVSQNKLTTAITQIGYQYMSTSQAGKWVGKFEYTGWYPMIRFYGDYGKEKSNYYQINKHYNSKNVLIGQDTVSVPYTQRVMNLRLDLAIPLNLSRGKMYRLLQPEIQVGLSHNWLNENLPVMIFRGSYIPLTYRLYGYNLKQQSTRDIQASWGQIVELQYRHTPIGDKELGKIASMEATLFAPGLFKNHGLKFYGGFQTKVSDNKYFNDLIYYPRGYSNIENNQLITIKSDYVMPVLYPDLQIAHLLYLKRITVRAHYDWSYISIPLHQTSGTLNKFFSSAGMELQTDCHFLRFIAPVKLGIRESYLIESQKVISEVIFSVNFNGF